MEVSVSLYKGVSSTTERINIEVGDVIALTTVEDKTHRFYVYDILGEDVIVFPCDECGSRVIVDGRTSWPWKRICTGQDFLPFVLEYDAWKGVRVE